MRNWYTAQELVGLPGMPGTVRAIQIRAQRERWEGQKRLGSKAVEYNIAVLPEVTRQNLMKSAALQVAEQPIQVPVVKAERAAVRPVSAHGNLSHRQTLTRDARLLIVNMVKRMQQDGLSTRAACIRLRDWAAKGELSSNVVAALALGNNKSGIEWAIRINEEGLPVAEAMPGQDVSRAARAVTCRTLERWVAMEATSGAAALVPGQREKDMSLKPWVPYLLAEMQRPQKPFLTDAHREMCKKLPPEITAPSYDVVYRWYSEKFSSLDKKRGRNQGSALNPHKYSRTRSASGMVPMQEIHSDGWGTHFTAPHPVSGKYVKLECWHTHDVATRYVFRPSVGLSESMLVILGSLYNAVAEAGVPAIWQTDNTGSVKNDRVSFDPVTSIQARAGIHIVHNLPGNSQANGICENFNKYLDRRARELATYMGKGMDSLAQKRVLRVTQKLVKVEDLAERRRLKTEAEKAGSGLLVQSFEQAQALLEQWCDDFNHTPHGALPKVADPVTGKRRHQTPAEAWAEHVAQGWQPVAVEGEQLHDLFRPHETKLVQRAKVRLYSQTYHHAELEHWNGCEVQVAYDVHDGERVWVKTLEGRLICEAKLDSVRGYRAQSVYEMAMEKRADAAIARHEAHIAEIERQRPVHVISHETPLNIPGLGDITPERLNARFADALTIDVQAERLPEPVLETPAPEEATTTAAVFILPPSPAQRYRQWRELEERMQAGESITSEQALRWFELYPQSKEFAAQQRQA